jgi:hypothetical protein
LLSSPLSLITPAKIKTHPYQGKSKEQNHTIQSSPKKDLFFKGNDKNSTKHAVELMEKGETAGNVLTVFLKSAEFENAVTSSALHGLESWLPFVNIVSKAPAMADRINDARTHDYKTNIKREMGHFFRNPTERNLEDWQKAEKAKKWGLLSPADDLYSNAINEFHNAADLLVGRDAPGGIEQNDLHRGISQKNTAVGSMFLFNDNTVDSWSGHSYSPSSAERMIQDVHTYGQIMLRRKYDSRFDLMTALKIGDLYKDKLSKKQLTHFYNSLCDLMYSEYQVSRDCDFNRSKYVNEMKLLQEHLKTTVRHHYINPDQAFHSKNGYSSPIKKLLEFDPTDWPDKTITATLKIRTSPNEPVRIANIETAQAITNIMRFFGLS